MKKVVLLIGLLVLIVALSGCTQTESPIVAPRAQDKFKIETQTLCDEYEAAGSFKVNYVNSCIESCGNKENYASTGCSGKWMACYCEKDPASIFAAAKKLEEELKIIREQKLAPISTDCGRFTQDLCTGNWIYNGEMIFPCQWNNASNKCELLDTCTEGISKSSCEKILFSSYSYGRYPNTHYTRCKWFDNEELCALVAVGE